MNPVGPRGHCDVEPIIDQHARAMWPRALRRRAREFFQRLCAHVLFTDLNELAAGSGRPVDRLELAQVGGRRGFRAVAECSAVGDQIE
jgi:hypothetical protein